jgi:hypothetical protein
MAQRTRARAIEAFQSDPPTTVFLLSMRSGAVGINLTAARWVSLLLVMLRLLHSHSVCYVLTLVGMVLWC